MNIGIDKTLRGFGLEMIEHPEIHCVKAAKWMLDRHSRGLAADIDPEEIRSLTQGMKRQHWQPNTRLNSEQNVIAYLKEYQSMFPSELEDRGIHRNLIVSMAERGILRRVDIPSRGKRCYYEMA